MKHTPLHLLTLCLLTIMSGLLAAGVMQSVHAQSGGVRLLDGDGFRQLIQNQDRPSLVFIYASWCPHCRTQKPVVEQIAKEYGSAMRVHAISIDKDAAGLNQYLANNPTPLSVYRVPQESFLDFRVALAATGSKFVGAIPYSIILSPEGKMLAEIRGFADIHAFKAYINSIPR